MSVPLLKHKLPF